MFNFISKIFKGIINFFTGFLGGKQSEGKFYKQLDESQEPAPQKPTSTSQPEQTAQATASKAESKPESKPAPQANQPQPKPQAKPQPKPEPVAATSTSQNGKVESESPSNQTFAPDYLIPLATQSRRRPGPSLDMFRDMARQVKTPSA